MRQGDVFPFRRQVFAIDVHRFYVQNGVGLVYADINGAEQSRKAPGRIRLFKENEGADQHQKAVCKLHSAAEVKDDGSGADGNAGELVDDELRQHIKNRRYLHGKEKLYPHLLEIDRAARERMDAMLPRMMEATGVTEELKARDPMRWVGLMNTLKAQVEEVILTELIYQ